MDINRNYSEGDTPIALKSDFILSFCELMMGGKNGLEAVEKTLIDRAVISVYRSYLADPKQMCISDRKNNLHDLDTWIFFKWIFTTFVAVLLVTNTWNIVIACGDGCSFVPTKTR